VDAERDVVINMPYSEEEKQRILDEARRNIELHSRGAVRELVIEAEDAMARWRREQADLAAEREQGKAELRYSQPIIQRAQELPPTWDEIDARIAEHVRAVIEDHIDTLKEDFLDMARTTADAFEAIADQREKLFHEQREEIAALRVEVVKLTSAYTAAIRAQPLDLPSLPRDGRRNVN
jgi:hypothetical protein